MNKENLQMEDIRDLLIEVAKTSDIKMTKNKRTTHKKDKPWFDRECKDIKEEITKCGKSLRTRAHCTETREGEDIHIIKD